MIMIIPKSLMFFIFLLSASYTKKKSDQLHKKIRDPTIIMQSKM